MPITAPKGSIADQLNAFTDNVRHAIISILQEEAMKTVDAIKKPIESGGYRKYLDQTGNLTSSIGYVIVVDGAIIDEYGYSSALPTATQGAEQGANYARQIASTFTEGIVVIISAGMNYAAYVERRNLGGMTAGEQGLRAQIHTRMVELQSEIKLLLSY